MPSIPPTPEDHTPDGQVADFIAHGLLAEDLIMQAQLGDLLRGLASGRLRAGDWRQIAKNALEMEVQRGKAAY